MRACAVIALLVSLAFTAGCPSPSSPGAPPPASADAPTSADAPAPPPGEGASSEAPAAEPVAIQDRELPVKCGCKLEVKKCSEWAEVDGRWVRLVGDHGMGNMPFCGKEGLRARVTGELKGDELHFTSITMVP